MIVRTSGHTTDKTTVRLTHEDSGSVIETMAPKDNGGEGLLFSPTDLCATSLGCCAATIMNMFAHNAGIPVAQIRYTVDPDPADFAPALRRHLDAEGFTSALIENARIGSISR